MRKRLLIPLTALLGSGLWSCAHKPTEELTNAKASVIAAREIGADRSQRSQTYLELARSQTARAHVLMDRGENHRAKLLLERAQADADVAMSLAREEPLRSEVRRTLAQVRTLQAAQGGTP